MSTQRPPVIVLLALVGLLLVAGAVVLLLRGGRASSPMAPPVESPRPAAELAPERGSATPAPRPVELRVSPPPAPDAGLATSRPLTELSWGTGPGQLGKPAAEEGHGALPPSIRADDQGGLVLLDAPNRRLLRLGAEGRPSGAPTPLSTDAEVRDYALTKDGAVVLLEAREELATGITVQDAKGAPRARLPLVAPDGGALPAAHGLVLEGDEVYVEADRGALVHVGNVRGEPSPGAPATLPGHPTSDGRGYVSASLVDPEAGRVHVYVVDKSTGQQRFSRELVMSQAVEGLYLVGSDAQGTVYLGLWSPPSALLVCLSGERGELAGQATLRVNAAAGETLRDAVVLDGGGVRATVMTKAGVRVEQAGCR